VKWATLILLLALQLRAADNQPVIYTTFVYNDFYTGRQYCSCYASNVQYGTLWEFQVNTNLATTNWVHFGSDYYTGWGTNYYWVPYAMADWPTDRGPQAFFRMRQIGTNFMFYPFYQL